MGLGLHGGGLESARYLARHGADCTVTDLRDEETLAPSIEKLESSPETAGRIRYVLGRHETDDFSRADMVIKNPGVAPGSPYLAAAKCVETDISLFLAASPARLIAVTGSKGKSSTASAIHWALMETGKADGERKTPGAWLGGNITVSPLSFLDELSAEDNVVLELSSWQLGDLRDKKNSRGGPLLKPRAAVLTAIMADHQDRYGGMDAYVDDKRVISRGQDGEDATIALDDPWGRGFLAESRGRPFLCSDSELPEGVNGAWLTETAAYIRIAGPAGPAGRPAEEALPAKLLVPGRHQKKNLLEAALVLAGLGIPIPAVRDALGRFPGIEHRLEFFHESGGIRFYNDTAATIPEAAAAAVNAFDEEPVLVCGGTDKDLDFSPLVDAAARTKAIVLLAGTGSDKLLPLLKNRGLAFLGPFGDIDRAASAAAAAAGSAGTVILSPGCASFGMFQNEFDRGRKWKEAVKRLV
jgi:UDP-N-acetylmuramoylalanine--D-glutamate ligase